MDLVEFEAPLDSSFQKDRLELVNKGSLGRRRKPSRSNLRLILSPANDQQDIDVFHNHQHFESDGILTEENGTPVDPIKVNVLDNRQESVVNGGDLRKNSSNHQRKDRYFKHSHQNGVVTNYREVVESINQIHSIKCVDFNGNSHQPVVSSAYHQNFTNGDHLSIIQNDKLKIPPENNNVKSKNHVQTSVITNQSNTDANSHQVFTKSNNSNYVTKSNNHSAVSSKNQNTSESSNCQRTENIRNQHNERKVSSNNHQNIITFSNHRQIITSTPIQAKKSEVPNGKHQERTSPRDCPSKVFIESSLPRTSKETNLVAEAQQFSIEAKLKRKKSEVQGRSAVLIQTWERRTQSESHSKLRSDSKTTLKNRFSGKEIIDVNSTVMPDSYICVKYKGSLQHGDYLLKGELVPNVRDVIPAETMLYRVSESRHRTHEKTTNGRVAVKGKSAQEPEWISLSRKLCAKFVEGHIESHSSDSYPHEEPEGVGEEPTPSLQSVKTHSGANTVIQTEVQKRKIIPTTPCEETPSSDEPPWIHLSRKLCTKFIEEHIEYPPITNGHFVEVPELIEPNGDVRIIEKIGKPKGHKSKQKKECEPEWISLSKKLRAKFIESHIDDPDTIALDNQLNASDHEETGSETLSDISQETPVPQEVTQSQEAIECRNFAVTSEPTKEKYESRKNRNNQSNHESAAFSEKECCWEYQEMEFDQESNSGNFQEIDDFDQSPEHGNYKNHREFLPQDSSDKFGERMTFENSCSQQNPECYNNDVKFAPRENTDESVSDCPQENKLITVQFIAHTGNDSVNTRESVNGNSQNNNSSKDDPFFNLSTWEEAQYKQDDEDAQQVSQNATSCKNCLSISIENLCDSSEEKVLLQSEDFDIKETQNSSPFMDIISPEKEYFPDSEKISNIEENGMHFQEVKRDPECSSNMSSVRNSSYDEIDDTSRESETQTSSWCNFYDEKKQNIYDSINVQSSSEDEVFEYDSRHKKLDSNSSEEVLGSKTSLGKSPTLENEKPERKVNAEKVKNDHSKKNSKSIKCNGMIPNSIYDGFPENKKPSDKNNQNDVGAQKSHKESTKLGMSKWITISKSEQNISKPEYSNVQSSIHKGLSNGKAPSEMETEYKNKSKKNNKTKNLSEKKTNRHASDKNTRSQHETDYSTRSGKKHEDAYRCNGPPKDSDLRNKCKSLCDISYVDNEGSFRQHESVADLCSATRTPNHHKIEFQHFEFNSEIPLCAKLVSRHDRKNASKSIPELSTSRMESPSPSDSSHVYEDMFKETPSGPSDSEASSWTAIKNNTYYVNGRSCSMNDLDFSDSCSLSVKCDYASSSENSTLQSRHSSYASSSFYVNLRDYDSHMLEPNLSKGKKSNGGLTNNGAISNISKSNPPTPESLRHLFTSPLSSVHSAPNRTPRLLNRMPSDPQSHYYSTAATTSSAFKHGFNLTPPKPKKTERSSSVKIKDIAHGILLTFKKFQNNSKNSSVSSTQQVDVSHLAEMRSNSEMGKSKKGQKDSKKHDKSYWTENGKTDTDSGFLSDVKRTKARRCSSDLTGMKPNPEIFHSDKKKGKSSKKGSKGKKNKTKASEPRAVPTVSRKVQQMADGTLYLVTTVSGDTTLPGVYSDSPDTSSELSSHRPVKLPEESNC